MTKDLFFAFSDLLVWNNSELTGMLEYNPVPEFLLKINALLLTRRLICKSNKIQPRQRDARLLIHAVF